METKKVMELRPGDYGFSVVVKVVDSSIVLNKARTASQGPLKIAEANVGDATGQILLSAKNAQLDLVQPGKVLLLEGAKIEMYRGTMRLTVDSRQGTIKEAEGVKMDVNKTIHMSRIEFDVITVDEEVKGEDAGAGEGAEAPAQEAS